MFDTEQALSLIASGASLREVGKQLNLGDGTAICKRAAVDPIFEQQYARAMELRADAHASRIEELADRVERGEIPPDAARVAIDARKWTAAKLRPKKYGDRIQADIDATIRVTVEDPTRPMQAQVIAQQSLPKTDE